MYMPVDAYILCTVGIVDSCVYRAVAHKAGAGLDFTNDI